MPPISLPCKAPTVIPHRTISLLTAALHLSMEEQASPVKDKNRDHNQENNENRDSPLATDPILRPGTYVIQVPKDQVYRIPPPENALIVERHRNPPSNASSRSVLCYLLLILIGIAVIIGLIAGISYAFFKPKEPEFYIQHVTVKNPNSKQSHPYFIITLKANNPNDKSGISYKKGGDVSLTYKQNKIATGKYPAFDQNEANAKVFDVTLHSSNSALPKEIDKSLKSEKVKVHASLLFKANVEIKFEIAGMMSLTRKLDVSCDLTVDSLAKSTHILSQTCNVTS